MKNSTLIHKSSPTYDLDIVHELAEKRKVIATRRVRNELINHGYLPQDTIRSILISLKNRHFVEAYELEFNPGTMADVYKVDYDGVEWYVKFFLDETEELHIELWSMHWW